MSNHAEAIYPRLVQLRRLLHQYPELAYQEEKTAQLLLDELHRLAIPCEYGGVGGGIIARLAGGTPGGPTVALRAEMDGLPVTEGTGLWFASRIPQQMHACGHDGHMAMVLGAAMLLQADPPPGNVVLIFQPAEEGGKGAEVMIRAGALQDVAMIFGGHMTRHYQTGQIMAPHGTVSAQADRLLIRVRGRGGHGARPHEGSDAVVASAALVLGLQTVVSRETNALDPTVVSIGTLRAGSAHNVIADEAVLDGTIRTTVMATRRRLIEALGRMGKALGEAYNTRIEVEVTPVYPPVVNNPQATEIARQAARQIVGDAGLLLQEFPSMGAEDFSFYLAQVPGCYVRFGARRATWSNIPLHSPEFDFDEELLKVGARYFDQVAREAIQALRPDPAGCHAEATVPATSQ
jgi:hippurate hydrolase